MALHCRQALLTHFTAYRHFRSTEDDHELVERGGLYGRTHHVGIGISADLCRSITEELLQLFVRGGGLAVLELYDVGVLHVLVDVAQGREEDVGITALFVQFGDGPIELVLAGHGQSEAMHIGLTLLLVTL